MHFMGIVDCFPWFVRQARRGAASYVAPGVLRNCLFLRPVLAYLQSGVGVVGTGFRRFPVHGLAKGERRQARSHRPAPRPHRNWIPGCARDLGSGLLLLALRSSRSRLLSASSCGRLALQPVNLGRQDEVAFG